MKYLLIAVFCATSVLLHAQTEKGKVLVLTNVSGHILIDGTSVGDIVSNKPMVQELSVGDHLVQLSYSRGMKEYMENQMVNIEGGKQKAVQFNVEATGPKTVAAAAGGDTIRVADLNVAITGGLAVGLWQNDHPGQEYAYPVFYYAFEKGDVVVIDVAMSNAKGTNVIEVATYPGNETKYSNRAFSALRGQTFKVNERCILRISLATNHTFDRNAFMRIRRVPAAPSSNSFSTEVLWRKEPDTTYTFREEQYLIKSDTTVVNPIDQVAKVSSQTAMSGTPNKTIVDFELPTGTVAWSYYIGVGQEGRAAFSAASQAFVSSAAKPLALLLGSSPMIPLALQGINYFSKVQGADNVQYDFITDWANVQQFMAGQSYLQYKQGNVVNDASQMKHPLTGKVYLGLKNDNVMEPIEVTVKVTAIVVKQQFGTRTVKDAKVSMRDVAYTTNE